MADTGELRFRTNLEESWKPKFLPFLCISPVHSRFLVDTSLGHSQKLKKQAHMTGVVVCQLRTPRIWMKLQPGAFHSTRTAVGLCCQTDPKIEKGVQE